MADKKNEFVSQLTPRDVDFSQWYTDVVVKTKLMDYAPVRGCMALPPYGYALWEQIQRDLDARFKETGHENVSMPLLIPESLLKKEADHVEGFAPEVMWVTHGGDEELTERLVVRPTSETLFCTMFAKWVESWRDLPMKYNQWCSVMRWEKTTRPFLRTAEFLWQEGHTIHATQEEADEETLLMLKVYEDFCRDSLAIPLFTGKKTEREKFAGALSTYSIEAMMQDGKALQAGTTHNFGDKFAKVFDVKFLDKDGSQKYVYETSWGLSTRLIGMIVMVHGDERGLVMPPRVAPYQVVVLPIAQHKPGVLDAAKALADELRAAGIRVKLDDRDTQSAGWKFNEWEMKGIPLRIEIGPRDIEAGQVMMARRDTFEKAAAPREGIAQAVQQKLDDIHRNMYDKAEAFRRSHITAATNMEEFVAGIQTGYVKAMWCGEESCEEQIKAETTATTRNIPFEQEHIADTCVHCGKPAKTMIYFAKAY